MIGKNAPPGPPGPRSRALISYEPPDWGQPVRPKDARGAHEAVRRFLERCTDCRGPEGVTLVASEPTRLAPPGYDSDPIVARLTSLFGPGQRSPIERDDAGGDPRSAYTWRLAAEDLDRGVDYLATLPAWPAQYPAPVHLSALFTFSLRDPGTGEVLAHQGPDWVIDASYARSTLLLFLGGTPSARVGLYLPFDEPGPDFRAYVRAITPYLPVQVAWSRFRLLTPNAAGTAYVRRKIGRT